MRESRENDLTQVWIKVRGADGRTRMEARWVSLAKLAEVETLVGTLHAA